MHLFSSCKTWLALLGASALLATRVAALSVAAPGTISAEVLDARDGATLVTGGQVTARLDCGPGCVGQEVTTPLEAGGFTFGPESGLTLTEHTALQISVPGFEPLLVAFGPRSANLQTPIIYLCPVGSGHFDTDGLCNEAEAWYGTDPENVDSDGDYVSDFEELFGRPLEPGYAYDIRALGADPRHLDIFLQINSMPGFSPPQRAIDLVVQAFANAPRTNPDGFGGIALHVLLEQEFALADSTPDFDLDMGFGALDLFRNNPKYFDKARERLFHYAIFARSLVGAASSGLSRGFGAYDLMVTLGDPTLYTADELVQAAAGTLMHELGHNLGLQHGGDDCHNYKPHYVSVMNYLYQFSGVPRDGVYQLDYARHAVAGFSESALDEGIGFTPAGGATVSDLAHFTNPHVCASGFVDLGSCDEDCPANYRAPYEDWYTKMPGTLAGMIDLDRSGAVEPGARAIDVSGDGVANRDYTPTIDDWQSLSLGGYLDRENVRYVVDQPLCPPPPALRR